MQYRFSLDPALPEADALQVRRMRKKIDRLKYFGRPAAAQLRGVPRQRRRIAGYIDEAGGLLLLQRRDDLRVHTGAGRVCKDDLVIRGQLSDKPGRVARQIAGLPGGKFCLL